MASCTPSALIAAAKCFPCLTRKQLAATTVAGTLNAGNRIIGGGLPCVSPSAPIRVGVLGVTNTTITIAWKPSKNSGSFITGWQVSWGTTSGGPYGSNSGTLPSTPKIYTISGLTPGTQYFFIVQAVAFAGCLSPNSSEVNSTTGGVVLNGLLNGLVHYWNMDSFAANTVNDIIDAVNMSGTNAGADMSLTNNGILNNCITCTGAAGVNQIFAAAPTATDLIVVTVPSPQSITYQCWFWLAAAQPAGNPIFVSAFSGAAGGQYMVMFAPAATNIPLFRYYNNAGVNVDLNWTGAVTRQAWHHFIGGYDSSVGESFMQIDNGARIFSAAFTPRGNSNSFDWCFFNGTSINNEMAGRLDEIGVWQRALSTTDVSNLWNGGNALSESSFTH